MHNRGAGGGTGGFKVRVLASGYGPAHCPLTPVYMHMQVFSTSNVELALVPIHVLTSKY